MPSRRITVKLVRSTIEKSLSWYDLPISQAASRSAAPTVDRFLSLLARETGGISRFVTAREWVDLAPVDLFASMGRPVASGLKATHVEPEPAQVVFAGTPVLLFGEIDGNSGERVELTWDGGQMGFDLPSGDAETGEAVRLLRGSRLITDWESRYPREEAVAQLEKRKHSRIAARLVELSGAYRLASREMSLVAVVKRLGDRPGELPETRVVAVGMPQDTAFPAYFSRAARQIVDSGSAPQLRLAGVEVLALADRKTPLASRRARLSRPNPRASDPAKSVVVADSLLNLAASLEPDGGMPGDSLGVRTGRSIAAVLAFASEGHTVTTGDSGCT